MPAATGFTSFGWKGTSKRTFWLDGLREKFASFPPRTVLVLQGCLSGVPSDRRASFNAGRNFWLELGRVVLFVEPIDREPELKRDFPDVFSVVRDEVKVYPPVTPPRLRQGEVESVDDKGVVCWVEIKPDERVKVRFASPLLAHLHPFAGMEFVWAADGEGLRPEQFSARQGKKLTPEERAELGRLCLAFREEVADWRASKEEE